ncbi:type II toxin-antitoxin system VapC family toxin [Gracilinema caldarium]|uniref:PilT protein domain protein n=1 Tax=Gracilinema caldarium (strain ATCC 51460 / DSM 7334 / H1) TaxID=744872 RepID=F8EXY1_GRAC1|nr:type II toxin-antitoxin system VapC family toxin [Gracilinema caldarium]AEJ20145.1 PilT protein domain protein [Gracilinema caldarium DSM 7334]
MGIMTYLLDTCTLLWWWSDPGRLSPRVLSLIKDRENPCLVSVASAWEVATKYRIGKYPQGFLVITDWEQRVWEDGFIEFPISWSHALKAGSLPGEHRDPFDRMIAAQAIISNISVLTCDSAIAGLGAMTVW